jgi:hypothetical protein
MDHAEAFFLAHRFWAWIAIGGAFLIGELMTGSGWLLWPASAAAVVAVISQFVALLPAPRAEGRGRHQRPGPTADRPRGRGRGRVPGWPRPGLRRRQGMGGRTRRRRRPGREVEGEGAGNPRRRPAESGRSVSLRPRSSQRRPGSGQESDAARSCLIPIQPPRTRRTPRAHRAGQSHRTPRGILRASRALVSLVSLVVHLQHLPAWVPAGTGMGGMLGWGLTGIQSREALA